MAMQGEKTSWCARNEFWMRLALTGAKREAESDAGNFVVLVSSRRNELVVKRWWKLIKQLLVFIPLFGQPGEFVQRWEVMSEWVRNASIKES